MEDIWHGFDAFGPNAYVTLVDGKFGGQFYELRGIQGQTIHRPAPLLSEYEESIHDEIMDTLF